MVHTKVEGYKDYKPHVLVENSISTKNLKTLEEMANISYIDPYADTGEWTLKIKESLAVVNRKGKLTGEILKSATKLRLIARTGIGVDETRIDLNTARERGILITYNPGINADSVAELTILFALASYRKLFILNSLIRIGEWKEAQSNTGKQLKGKTWGFVGFGNVAFRTSCIINGMGLRSIAFDPYLSEETIKSRGAEPSDMETLLRESDIVSVHVPLTNETRHLISEREISMMKKEAILINVSRGGIFDDKALFEALKTHRISMACIDTPEEEPIKPENPLLKLDNIIITPHIGGSTEEALAAGSELAVDEVIRFLKGEPPRTPYLNH